MTGPDLSAIAAPGSDPDLVARVLARALGPRGAPTTVAREAVGRTEELGADPDDTDPEIRERLLALLAPAPSVAERDVVRGAVREWVDLGVRAAVVGDPAYPRRLSARWPANGAPLLLAWRGAAPTNGPAVAIVGARRATSYGTGVAAWMAETAAGAGIRIVSGGAVGIDAAAHAGALEERGGTTVVLGCGHAFGYPRAHARPGGLFDRVLDAGGTLLSELPPQGAPKPPNVLARNRIVAGLADAVLVVEGGRRSGSLHTAGIAADNGVPVLAVPGDVRAPGSAAPHALLADGAAPCARPQDLIDVVRGSPQDVSGADGAGEDGDGVASCLPTPALEELRRRWPRPVRIDELAAATGVPTARLLAAVTRARIAGEIAQAQDGVRLRRAPST